MSVKNRIRRAINRKKNSDKFINILIKYGHANLKQNYRSIVVINPEKLNSKQ